MLEHVLVDLGDGLGRDLLGQGVDDGLADRDGVVGGRGEAAAVVIGVQELVDEVTYINGVEVGRKNLSTKVVTEPVDKEVVTGTKVRPKLSGVGTGSLIWPVPSIHNITSYFEYN